MGWLGNSKWQRSPKWLNLSILNPLSPWERVRERAVSASLLWANANLAGSLSNFIGYLRCREMVSFVQECGNFCRFQTEVV